MMFGLAKMFRPVSKIFTLCNNLVIRPNTIEFKILHRKYIELVSKLTTRGPKWNFVTALLPQRANNEKKEFTQLQKWTGQRGFSAWGIQTGPFAAC